MLVSSILAHASTTGPLGQEGDPEANLVDHSPTVSAHSGEDGAGTNMFRCGSIVLQRLGKVIATFDAIWIIVTCIFQFSNFFSWCFCNSSVFGLGQNVIILTAGDIPGMRNVWIGAVFLALGSAFIYTAFVNVFINPPLPA